uniref:Putative secreted protein n=1 Tax=Ixodes ricinus TaxID=34613 RepID=A0A6B0UJ34_IXORI
MVPVSVLALVFASTVGGWIQVRFFVFGNYSKHCVTCAFRSRVCIGNVVCGEYREFFFDWGTDFLYKILYRWYSPSLQVRFCQGAPPSIRHLRGRGSTGLGARSYFGSVC